MNLYSISCQKIGHLSTFEFRDQHFAVLAKDKESAEKYIASKNYKITKSSKYQHKDHILNCTFVDSEHDS